jgi:hypothetical protein
MAAAPRIQRAQIGTPGELRMIEVDARVNERYRTPGPGDVNPSTPIAERHHSCGTSGSETSTEETLAAYVVSRPENATLPDASRVRSVRAAVRAGSFQSLSSSATSVPPASVSKPED